MSGGDDTNEIKPRLTIKDHIDRGHYPKDMAGRAAVPHIDGDTILVLSTNGLLAVEIVGWRTKLSQPVCFDSDSKYLVPPEPRETPVERWAVMRLPPNAASAYHITKDQAIRDLATRGSGWHLVCLSGAIVEDWS